MRWLRLFVVLVAFAPFVPLLADDGSDAHKLGLEAARLRDSRKPAEALALAEKAAKLRPQDPYYHGLIGAIHCDLKRYASGLKECETAIQLAGGKDDAWYIEMAGENAYGVLDFPLARKYFRQVVGRGDKALARSASERLERLSDKTLAFDWVLQPGQSADPAPS